MASLLKVDKLDPQSGTALEIGTSGDTITVPTGATFAVSGTMNASSITAGTLAVARGGTGITTQAIFQADLSSSQTGVADATWTKVAFNNDVFDDDSVFDTSNNRFIAPSDGKYVLNYQVYCWAETANGSSHLASLYKNGSNFEHYASIYLGGSDNYIAESSITNSVVLDLSTSDYIA